MAKQAKYQFSIGKPVRIPKGLREEIEGAIQAHLAAVEKLTAVLDKADGDSDFEPSLAGLNCIGSFDSYQTVTPAFDQERWSQGNPWDLEDQHDGREPEDAF